MRFNLNDIDLFVRIVEMGSLSAAARERDMPVSQVTRSLARLEASCGVQLLHRTTHRLSLTDEGDTLLSYGRSLLNTSDELVAELTGKLAGPSGWVRISTSAVIAEMLIAQSLTGLYEQYPQLHVDINSEDRMIDMARDGIDVAIRTGEIAQDTVVARQIGFLGRTLVATPAYLARHGTPQTVADLDHHHLITNRVNPQISQWPLLKQCKGGPYMARGGTRTENSAVLLTLVRAGVGLGRVMNVLAAPLIRSGELVAVLQDQLDSQRVPIFAVMLQERQRLPKIRACIDYWAAWLVDLERQVAP